MQYLILPNFGLHSEGSTLVQELNAMVHVSVPKKYWQHRQLTWSQVRKWLPIPNCLEFEEYRGDLFHGIHKGHEQQMEIQHAALRVTCSLQTCMYLNYTTSRQTALLGSCRKQQTQSDKSRAPCHYLNSAVLKVMWQTVSLRAALFSFKAWVQHALHVESVWTRSAYNMVFSEPKQWIWHSVHLMSLVLLASLVGGQGLKLWGCTFIEKKLEDKQLLILICLLLVESTNLWNVSHICLNGPSKRIPHPELQEQTLAVPAVTTEICSTACACPLSRYTANQTQVQQCLNALLERAQILMNKPLYRGCIKNDVACNSFITL